MERTKDSNQPIRWKKIGGGGFMFNGRLIKPGQVFTARPDQLSKTFRDVCVPLDELPEPTPEPKIPVTDAVYSVSPRGNSKIWYDVVDSKGKVINEKALKKDAAEQFAKDLNG